jgi:L-lysine 6-transaminase
MDSGVGKLDHVRCRLGVDRAKHALIGDVRGRGLMCAVDLPTPEQRTTLIKAAFAQNLLLLPSGSQTVRFRPFLNVKSEHLQEMLVRFTAAISALS